MNETEEIKHYAKQIFKIVDKACKIMFMRKVIENNLYIFLNIVDIAWIRKSDTVSKIV